MIISNCLVFALLSMVLASCSNMSKPVRKNQGEVIEFYSSYWAETFSKPEHYVIQRRLDGGEISRIYYKGKGGYSPKIYCTETKHISTAKAVNIFKSINLSGLWNSNINNRNRSDYLDADIVRVIVGKGRKTKEVSQYGEYDFVIQKLHAMLRSVWREF